MSFVTDVTEAQFDEAVLARSRTLPVVVDFWAEWCAPCRVLGPVLEREVTALGGRVLLAKVDVDRAQALGARFRVQGIPAVMAFRDGAVVADFVGARDAAFVREWLAGLAPSESRRALAAAQSTIELERLLDDAEVGPEAALQLATQELEAGHLERVTVLLERAPARGALAVKTDALRQRLSLAVEAAKLGGEAGARARLASNANDVEASYALGAALAAKGDWANALEAFLGVVSRDRRFKDDGARKAMLVVFERLGPQHELTRDFRRRLQIVL